MLSLDHGYFIEMKEKSVNIFLLPMKTIGIKINEIKK
mgnify:CR=1 FL=1